MENRQFLVIIILAKKAGVFYMLKSAKKNSDFNFEVLSFYKHFSAIFPGHIY